MNESLPRVSAKEAKNNFGQVAGRVGFGGEKIVVTKNGRDLFAMISLKDLETLIESEKAAGASPTKAAINKAAKRMIPIEEVYRDFIEETRK